LEFLFAPFNVDRELLQTHANQFVALIAIKLFRALVGLKNHLVFRTEDQDGIVGPLENLLINLRRKEARWNFLLRMDCHAICTKSNAGLTYSP